MVHEQKDDNNNSMPILRIRLKLNYTKEIIERKKDITLKKKRKRSTSSSGRKSNKRKDHKKVTTNNTVTLPTTNITNNANSGYWTSEQIETNKLILRNCQFAAS